MTEHNQSKYYIDPYPTQNMDSYNNPYKFNGKEMDKETGMYYYGARYYDPRLSIFISVDPLAEEFVGWTPYHYVHNNPINLIDPTGMAANGWIEWTTKQGDKQMTYDQGVDTKEDAIRKGYKNVESVIESGYYNSGGDSYELKSDGKVINEH